MKKILNSVFGFIPRCLDRLVELNQISFMSDEMLMQRIHNDMADGRINTDYSREYDRRRPFMNKNRTSS